MLKAYSTRDTQEAAFLWCQAGVDYTDVTVTAERKRSVVTFHFELGDEIDIQALRKSYYNGTSSVEPKTFINKLNDVKSILYAELKSK